MDSLPLLFLVVFALNLLPAFAPPTWMLLSYLGLRFPGAEVWWIAGVAAVAATCGRAVLARFAQAISASGWLPRPTQSNLVSIAAAIERRRATSSMAVLLYAFTPLPSNALFLAYGLAQARLALVILPFFVGRFVSYGLAFAGGEIMADHLDITLSGRASALYFVLSQLASIGMVYGFAQVDWRRSRREWRLRWVA